MASPKMKVTLSNPALKFKSTQTEDARLVSVIFDNFLIVSDSRDETAQPEALSCDLIVAIPSQLKPKTVTVTLSGSALASEAESWCFISAKSGKSRVLMSATSDSTSIGALTLVIEGLSKLRISLLVLAQRSLSRRNSSAQAGIDTVDLMFA